MKKQFFNQIFKKPFFILSFIILVCLVTWGTLFIPERNQVTLEKQVPVKNQVTSGSEGSVHIEHWKTSQGTEVYFVPTQGLPIVDVAIHFDAGSSRDGEKFGLAALCSGLLEEGTQKLTAEDIAEKLDDQGALFEIKTDRDKTLVRLRSLNDPTLLKPVSETISEIIAFPSFPEKSLAQYKNQALVELKKNQQQPNIIAIENFIQGIYGQHPYGHLITGTEKTVSEITQSDCKVFHKEFFVSNNARITIVGGLDKNQARELAEQLMSKLEKGKAASALPEVQDLEKPQVIKKPFQSQQTHIYLGQPGQIVGDKDYFPMLVGNFILGQGSLVSRLFQEVREKRGLAYVATSSIEALKKPGPFLIYLQTKTNQTEEARRTINAVLENFIEKGPTEEELEAAKKGIIASFPLMIGSNFKITDIVSDLNFYGLPLDFLDTYRENVQKVTREQVQEVFKRRIHPDKMVLVVVGNDV